MSMNYGTFITGLGNLLVVSTGDANFVTDLPNIIDQAEQRCYRELDLLTTRVTDQSTNVVAFQRTFTLPVGTGKFYVVEELSIIIPSSASYATGTRVPLVQTSKQFIDFAYPSASSAASAQPEFFAVLDDLSVVLGPCPDMAYPTEVQGTQRPLVLSSANSSTWLTKYVPDLFMASAMVRAAAYQRNWSAQGDDPKMALSWENTYQQLKASTQVEEFRKMARSQGWTVEAVSPIATPPRT